MTMTRGLGWIGVGRMGEAMIERLLAAGNEVVVWNRTRSKADAIAARGAQVADQKLTLSQCEAVFTMVSTTADLREVLFGEGGVVTGSDKPRLIVDCSSISEEGSRDLRRQLEAVGVRYLCAPVSGNAGVCKAGKLSVVASGPRDLFDRAKPWLDALGRSTIWVGDYEQARVWKIAHNTIFGVIIQSLCEITVLAEKAVIPRHVFLESINNSVVGSMYTKYKTPALVTLTFDHVTFTPKLLLKDMDLGLASGHAHAVTMPCAAAARESISAMVGRGHENIDFSVLLMEVARDSGLELTPEGVVVSDGLA